MGKCWFTFVAFDIMIYLLNHEGESCSAVKIYKKIGARYAHVWKTLNILKKERLVIIKPLDHRTDTSSLTERGKILAKEFQSFEELWV